MSQKYPGGFVTLNPPVQNPALGAATPGVWTLDQALSAEVTRSWPMYDPYYKNVVLNLHGNGTNGAQNNTFLDSSTNNFTITRNGNTTQGSFSPYGSLWSNYFDGTGDYLAIAYNAALEFGSSDFTIEFWVYLTGLATIQIPVSQWETSGNKRSYNVNISTTGQLTLTTSSTGIGTGNTDAQTAAGAIAANSWTHVRISKSGTTAYLGVNGVITTGSAVSSLYSPGTNPTLIGAYISTAPALLLTGYISNVRLLKGTALSTGSSYVVPTEPLTAITNTSLLTCQSNRFVDNSASPKTIVIYGDTKVQRFSPFNQNLSYTPETIGGSGYFDGTGDYLTTASSSNLALGTGDFTIEGWLYWFGTACRVMGGNTNGNTGVSIDVNSSGQIGWGSWLTGAYSTQTIKANAWNHFAYVRASGTDKLYINGVLSDSTTWGLNFTDTTFYVGIVYNTTIPWYGYQADVRIIKGTAIYSGSTYTMPTAPLTAVANTQLLLSMTNAGIPDNAMMNDLETVGNAQVSTSVKKYGTGSMYFDGTGDYLVGQSIPINSFGTGDFTFECWAYFTSFNTYEVLACVGDYSAGGIAFYVQNSGSRNLKANINNVDSITLASGVSTNTWYHLAITRSGTTLRGFIDGVAGTSGTNSANITGSQVRVGIGYYSGSVDSGAMNGYIDDLRITKGVARYVANFTPPTSQLQDQ